MTMVDKILFPSGSADVSKGGKQVLDKVIAILKDIKDKRIQVEGHTDNVRIVSAIKTKYPTNWELSTARATQVVRYLQEAGGIDPKQLSAIGYAEYQPVALNDTDEGKAKNRRIEIVLLPLLN
jgi:chemotaxis protein MotB